MNRAGIRSPVAPATSSSGHSGFLQRKCACGSAASGITGECEGCQLRRGFGLQPKLAIGADDDPFEREADRVAERVMRMPDPGVQRRVEDEEEENEEEGLLQAKPRVQRRTPGGQGAGDAPPVVHEVLRAPGQSLDPGVRRFFEPRFGHDFSRVRVHTDSMAAAAADAVHAHALALGSHLVFAAGQLAPHTTDGKRLLAHELAHTIQQEQDVQAPFPRASPGAAGTDILTHAAPGPIRRKKRGHAGGCGLCLPPPAPLEAGRIAHEEIQDWFTAGNPDIRTEVPVTVVAEDETPPFEPRLDLAYETYEDGMWVVYIGEIKPLDDEGEQRAIGRNILQDYARELRFSYDEVYRMDEPAPDVPLPFANPLHPRACTPQFLYVTQTEPGLYQYYCDPAWADLQAHPECRCDGRKKRKQQRKSRAGRISEGPSEGFDVFFPENRKAPAIDGLPEAEAVEVIFVMPRHFVREYLDLYEMARGPVGGPPTIASQTFSTVMLQRQLAMMGVAFGSFALLGWQAGGLLATTGIAVEMIYAAASSVVSGGAAANSGAYGGAAAAAAAIALIGLDIGEAKAATLERMKRATQNERIFNAALTSELPEDARTELGDSIVLDDGEDYVVIAKGTY